MKSLLIVLMMFTVTPLYADATGAGDAAVILKLTSIYTTLKKEYTAIKDGINEYKQANETLTDMKNTYKEVRNEYRFIKNFSTDREINNIKGDIEDITMLDNMEGRSLENRLDIVAREIGKHTYMPSSGTGDRESRENEKDIKKRLESIENIKKAHDAKLQESIDLASGKIDRQKNIDASNASSNALIAAIRLGEEKRRKERELAQKIQSQRTEGTMDNFADTMKSISNGK